MRLAGNDKEIHDLRTGRMRHTAIGAWIKHWWHWGVGSATDCLHHYRDTESHFGRCFEKVGYERHIGDIRGPLRATPFPEWTCDLAELIGAADRHDLIYLLAHWQYGVRNVDSERRTRTSDRGVLAKWHNVELFATPPKRRNGLCAGCPEWRERVKCCQILSVLTALILAYYTNHIICYQSGRTSIWYVAALEFVILALMRFVVVAERRAEGYDCRCSRMGHGGYSVIPPLWNGVQRRLNHLGFAQFVTGCSFNPAATYVAYRRSAKIDLSSLRPSGLGFRTPLLMESINYPPLKSRRVSTPPVASLSLLRCLLHVMLLGWSTNWTSVSLLTILRI